MTQAELRIGISGWRYPGWRGDFYPSNLPQKRELEFVSHRFNSVELNGSFYSLQRPERYAKWREETPPGFVFSVKGGRYITHMKRLRDIDRALANFFASGVLQLREKLGPLLWQFPATFPFDERFEAFLERLPATKNEAVRLARHHDDRVPSFSAPRTRDHALRHAVEVRNQSFVTAGFIELLRKHQVSIVVADSPAFPRIEDITAPFVYLRLHGGTKLYESGYGPQALDYLAQRVRSWSKGSEPSDAKRVAPRCTSHAPRDVYVYFDNDAKVRAPFDALELARRLSIKWQG